MPRQEVRGAAPTLTLQSGITAGSGSCLANGTITNWPTGAAFNFTIRINAEKILCSALSGSNPATIVFVTRGYDDTAAASHDASAEVKHILPAALIEDFLDHVYDVTRDDHTQYIKQNGSEAFTGSTTLTATAVSIGTANQQGVLHTLSRSDHVHALGAGIINSAAMFGAGVVDANAIAADAVGASELADNAVAQANMLDASVGTAELIDANVTDAKLAANLPRGVPTGGYAQATTDQTAISSEVDATSLSVTITLPASRRIRVSAYARLGSTGVGNRMSLRIYEGGTQLQEAIVTSASTDSTIAESLSPVVILTPTAASHTYKLRVAQLSGGGGEVVRLNAAATEPAFILVEDIGSA